MPHAQQEDSREANRLVWWLLGVLTAVLISLVGAWGKGINTDVSQLKEATYAIPLMSKRLDNIEGKLDKILEKR